MVSWYFELLLSVLGGSKYPYVSKILSIIMEPRDFEQHISIKNLAPIHVGKTIANGGVCAMNNGNTNLM